LQQQDAAACSRHVSVTHHWFALLRLLLIGIFVVALVPSAQPVYAASYPQLWLPQPVGQPWKIIQGYACGTHNSFDRYAIDTVPARGPIYGAPVHAAADGTVFGWFGSSGTLILKHTDTFYTQYTHLQSVNTAARGQFVPRGAVVGTVGDRGSPGVPHLHFMAFTAHGPYASGRQTIPLTFADGYTLPEIGGCNQHYGKILTAKAPEDLEPPEIEFSGDMEPEKWYNDDRRLDFTISGAAQGFSQRWNEDPGGEEPMFENAKEGYVQLTWADVEGLHTLYVRIWSITGEQILETFGPVGYDITPPEAPSSLGTTRVQANTATKLSWQAAEDNASGVAGYRVYVGTEADGEAEWYTSQPQVELPPLTPGKYNLRVQVLDNAGNVNDWQTIGQIVSQADGEALPEATATPTRTAAPETTPTRTTTPETTPTSTAAPEATPTATPAATSTPEPEATDAPEATSVPTATATPTTTSTPEPEATDAPEATSVPTATATPTATRTPEPEATDAPEATSVPTATATPTATSTPEPEATSVPTATATPSPTATATATEDVLPDGTKPLPQAAPSATATPSPTATAPAPNTTVTPPKADPPRHTDKT
jgi:hypothetical protein